MEKINKKLIFLDIDGVLNDEKYFETISKKCNSYNSKKEWKQHQINPEKIELLNTVMRVSESNNKSVEIVISSSWRKSTILHDLKYYFTVNGFKFANKIINTTPSSGPIRGLGIRNFINLYKLQYQIEDDIDYVIIDDDQDMLYEQRNNFVHVDNKIGLSVDDVTKIIKILKI